VSNQPTRNFTVKDDALVMHAALVKEYYVEHQERFIKLNVNKFGNEYPTVIADAIGEARNTVSDAFILMAQVKESADVKDRVGSILLLHSKLSYYIKASFEDSITIDKFCITKTKQNSTKPDLFIGCLKDLLITIDRHMDVLTANGLRDELVTDLKNGLDDLEIQRREQKDAILSRPHHTLDRIEKMNSLWKHLTDMRDASLHIFDDRPELVSLFELPKLKSHSTGRGELLNSDVENN
jgi:hypothetical protein